MHKWTKITDLPLDGGCPCFNFINTKGTWKKEKSKDFLTNYSDILTWLERQKVVEEKYVEQLKDLANSNYSSTHIVFKKLLDFRELVYLLFSQFASTKQLSQSLIQRFNQFLKRYGANLGLQVNNSQLIFYPRLYAKNLEEPLWLLIHFTKEIIENEPFKKIKECPECGWIFIDRTKGNRQKFCNPNICGARVKMRKYYQRKKNNLNEK